jgi:hypothetical protein
MCGPFHFPEVAFTPLFEEALTLGGVDADLLQQALTPRSTLAEELGLALNLHR